MAGHRLTCTFCKRSQDQVRKLVAGPGVYICDACIERAHAIVHDGPLPAARPSLLGRVAARLRRFARRTDRSVLLATEHIV